MGEKLYGFSCGHDTWKLQENLPVFQVSQKCSHLFIKDFHENVTNWNSLENFWNNRKYICVSFLFSSALSSRFNLNQELGSLFPCQPSRTSEHAVWKLLSSSKDTDEQCCMLWVCSEQFLLLCLAQYIHHVQHQHYLQHWISLVKDKQIKRNRRPENEVAHMSEFSGPWMTLLYMNLTFSVHRSQQYPCLFTHR